MIWRNYKMNKLEKMQSGHLYLPGDDEIMSEAFELMKKLK